MNLQLRIYAGGAMAALTAQGNVVQEVTLVIVQPRSRHHLGPVRSATVNAGEIMLNMGEVFGAQLRALAPNPPAIPGDHCRFCPVRATCPERRALALSVAQDQFGNLPDDPRQLPQPITLSDGDMGRILALGAFFETWLDDVRQHAHHRLEHGYHIPGWKLVLKRATRKWIDEDAAESTLRYSLGESYELHTHKLKSPAQLEKEIGKKGLRAFHDLISAESSGTTLAPDYDARQEVRGIDAQTQFGALPDA